MFLGLWRFTFGEEKKPLAFAEERNREEGEENTFWYKVIIIPSGF